MNQTMRSLRLLAVAAVAALLWACNQTHATVAPGDTTTGLVVVGTGEANGQPDIARIDVGVMVRAATVAEATEQASQRAQAVIGALADLGVEGPDIRTRNVSVHEERTDWGGPPRPVEEVPEGEPKPGRPQAVPTTHYVAQNMLEITVRDLDALGKILAAATQAGANQMHGIRLEIDDPKPLMSQARQKAVADARAQAEQLAQLSGVKLGELVSVRAMSHGGPQPIHLAAERDMAASVPIERGELTVTQQVELRFALRN